MTKFLKLIEISEILKSQYNEHKKYSFVMLLRSLTIQEEKKPTAAEQENICKHDFLGRREI